MKRVLKLLQCIVPFLCALLIQIGVSFLVIVILVLRRSSHAVEGGEINPDAITGVMEEILSADVVLAISALSALACILVFGIWYRNKSKKENGNGRKGIFTLKSILYMLLLAVGLQVGISVLLNVMAMIKPEWFDNYDKLMEQLGMGNSILSLAYIALIAPISEELIFRGVVLGYSKKALPIAAANILQALLFGIYHMNLVQGLYAFAIGMFLGAVRIQFNSLYASVLLHMMINISGIFLNLILTDEVFNMPIAVIAIAILSLAAILFGSVNLTGKHSNDENDIDIYR